MVAENYFAIESFGVRIKIYAYCKNLLQEIEERIEKIIPDGLYKKISPQMATHSFSIRKTKDCLFVLYKSRKRITGGNDKDIFLKFFEWQIRLAFAEFAVDKVFIHAGVIGWNGKAIILPAKSFQGKTTFVKTLTEAGATYYSDEYAVLDDRGYVHPYPKTLSIRSQKDSYSQIEYPVEIFGGVKGEMPIPVGMILFTEFEEGAEWLPEMLTQGDGLLNMLSHTISIRYNPNFAIKVLNKTVNRAIIVKTKRGEAKDFALKALRFFEKNVF